MGAVMWTAGICGSRIYFQVCSPADVQGGMLLGAGLLRLWLPVSSDALLWIRNPASELVGPPVWLALPCLAVLLLLCHPLVEGEQRSLRSLMASISAIAFVHTFIVGTWLLCLGSGPQMLPLHSVGVGQLLARNVVGFATLLLAHTLLCRVALRLMVAVAGLLKSKKGPLVEPKILISLGGRFLSYSGMGLVVSYLVPLMLTRMGIN